ncbi:hypothetical protein [Blastopirellula marina]|uniref:Uncharacterized protein n=1 Tax=Blastopirellula marina TaxID=124 RepID=A0A2S8GCX3_9BACT|nr:hypothetical protein [Blastopirellula marina]PQO41924.1 hypothetical protein C5Y98_02485 [Blastopirellula marina]PTL46282.1 hypothetical protein C5Y97_02485 [Blastopirellula marina]
MIALHNTIYTDLKPLLNSRRKIRIERRRPANPHLNGYLVGLSPELGMMHCFDDFEADGYTIFFLDDIESIRSSEYERHWDHMLAAEGLLGGLDCVPRINLASMDTALVSAAKQPGIVIIQCEELENSIEDFFIGQIASIGTETVWFDNFSALGMWDETSEKIALNEITLVQLDTVYAQTFSKYVTGTPASKRTR